MIEEEGKGKRAGAEEQLPRDARDPGDIGDLPKEGIVSQDKGSGGTGCGWLFGIVALVIALGSLGVSIGVGAGSLTNGTIGLPEDVHDVAGVLFVVALVALGLAKRGETH